jgi:hypothetical protein
VAISLISGLDVGNFRNLQKVNKISIEERDLPSEEDLLGRLRERMAVKVEQEIRHISQRERTWKVDRLIPVVESMAANEDGRRELAAICASYLREHRPETTIRDEAETTAPQATRKPSKERGRRRRRRKS